MPKCVRQPAATACTGQTQGVCESVAPLPSTLGPPNRRLRRMWTVPLRQSEVEEPLASVETQAQSGQPERQQHAQRDGGPSDWSAFVGSVAESREEHLKRHGGGLRSCPSQRGRAVACIGCRSDQCGGVAPGRWVVLSAQTR